jgi:hypothetical protein
VDAAITGNLDAKEKVRCSSIAAVGADLAAQAQKKNGNASPFSVGSSQPAKQNNNAKRCNLKAITHRTTIYWPATALLDH